MLTSMADISWIGRDHDFHDEAWHLDLGMGRKGWSE